jgi:hypothetical protein
MRLYWASFKSNMNKPPKGENVMLNVVSFFEYEALAVPDTMKVEELMELIEKKLELTHEMVLAASEKLLKQGYTIVSGLKSLTKEGWDKLELPLAIEEELKNQITPSGILVIIPLSNSL